MELERRRARNNRYSLRAFARSLAIDHSTLSQILRGTRRVTRQVIASIGRRLRKPEPELAEFCALENDAAILEAIHRPDFQPDSRWLAMRLGIPLDAVNVSLHRLLYKGMLVMRSRKRWEAIHG